MSTLIRLLSVAVLATAFTAGAQAQQKSSISVGISVGTTEKIFDVVKQVAARDGLEIKLVKFNDYQLPNAALNAGDLDANAFQHKPFLDNQIKARGFDIVPVGLTVTAPLGFYSRKIKALGDLPEGASVGIQNDPSNGNRAPAPAGGVQADHAQARGRAEEQRHAAGRGVQPAQAQAGAAGRGAVAALAR